MKLKILSTVLGAGLSCAVVAPSFAQVNPGNLPAPSLGRVPAVADRTAPVISNVLALSLLPTAATISWTTDELADSRLEYGTTLSYGTQPTLDASLTLLHSAVLLGLSPSTTYYYCVHSKDFAGNNASDCGRTFTTVADPFPVITVPPDTSAPVITNVFGVSVVPTEATITWTTNELADSRIEYGTTLAYGSQATLGVTLSLAHSATILGLTPATTYYFCVHSTDTAGNAARECGRSFVTAAVPIVVEVPPPIISTVAIAEVTPTSASITWITDAFADTQVEFGFTNAYGQFTVLDSALALNHSAVLSNLVPATQYHFRVKSSDLAGNVVVSADYSFTTAALEPGSVPSVESAIATDITGPIISGITALNITATDAAVTLSTNELAVVQIEFGETAAYGNVTTIGASLDWVHVRWLLELSPGTRYHYRVRAIDVAGNVTLSRDLEFTSLTDPMDLATVPSISNVSITSVDATSATITWTTDVPAYSQIDYGTSNAYGSVTETSIDYSTSHQATISGLVPNSTYHFRVKSKEAVGNFGVSTDLTFKTEAVLDRPPPQTASDLAVSSVEQTSVTLSWSRPTDISVIDHYHIRFATHSLTASDFRGVENIHDNVLYVSQFVDAGANYQYTVVGLTPGATYYFAVQAVDSDSINSPISNVASATTRSAPIVSGDQVDSRVTEVVFTGTNGVLYQVNDTTAPGQPVGVKAQSLDSQIALYWTNPNDIDFLRLRIVRKLGAYPDSYTDGEVIYDGNAEAPGDNMAVFTDTGLLNNQTYYYGFYAYDKVPNLSAPVRLSVAPKAGAPHKEFVLIPGYLALVPSISISKNLSFGTNSHEIEHIQELLATDPTLYPAGHIDGHFGSLMKRAITKLQARHGLVQNGKIDDATRLKIIEISKLHQIVELPHESLSLVLARDLYLGTTGEDVRYLQKFLRDRGFYPEGLITGAFDHQLEHAVMRFKQRYRIEPVSGYAGIHVRRQIHNLVRR